MPDIFISLGARTIFFYLILLYPGFLKAQCPTLNFTIPNSVCIGEDIVIDNMSAEALNFEWDFCSGDLLVDPVARSVQSNPSLRGLYGLELVNDNGTWLLFATDRDNNSLLRFTFSEGLNSSPTAITDLGDLGGLLVQPRAIKLYKVQDRWQGLVLSVGNENLINIDFSEGLNNMPRGNVLLSGIGDPNSAMNLVQEGNSLLAFVTYYSTSKIDIVSLENIEGNTSVEETMSFSVPVSTNIRDIDLIKDCDDWYGILVARRGRTVQKLRFGSNLFSVPTFDNVPDNKNVRPMAGRFIYENGEYYVVVLNENGDFVRLDFGDSLNNGLISATNFGNFGILSSTRSIETIWDNGTWYTFTANAVTNELFSIDFSKNCGISKGGSRLYEPNSVSYNLSGTFTITLTGYNDSGGFSSLSKNINVTNSQAPQLAIEENETQCLSTVKTFSAIISDELVIDSYQWSFGDGSPPASGQEVTHQYTTPGTYPVTLEVESANGCGNRLTKEITIYEPPVPNFTTPTGQVCTNGAVNFINTTNTQGADSLITYQWFVDDELVSEEANPAITFAEGGSRTVRLEAGIPGCTETTEKTVNVLQGPTVSFSVAQICQGDPIVFENLTTGEGITGYAWDFGDGGSFSSTTPKSPTYTFETAGTYTVALTVSNALGCQNVYTQEVTVYEQPSVGFLSEVACVGTPTQFTDTTTAGTNANVIAWQWYFGDGLGTAEVRNPTYAYPQAGTYDVKLITQTTAGCTDSAFQTVTVESPVIAGFSSDSLCPTDEAPYTLLLSDTSLVAEGDAIDRWFWTVNGENFVSSEVAYAFPAPGAYEVSLTAFAASGCNATVTQSVQVDSLPELSFTYANGCTGDPVVFQSQVTAPGIVSYTWDVTGPDGRGAGTAFEANPSFTFAEPGSYEVSLTVQTDDECTFTTTQTVAVTAAPVAAFTASPDFGGAPLEVTFENTSTDAAQYSWDFAGISSSEEVNPAFTFTDVGSYTVTLTATNAQGCTATTQQTVEVVAPVQDLRLEDIIVSESTTGDAQQILLSVSNRGSLIASGITVTIDLDETLTVQEQITQPVLPGETIVYPTRFQLPVQQRNQQHPLRYLCVRLEATDTDFVEEQPENNRNCISLNREINVEPPFPNPASDVLRISVILPEPDAVSLQFMNSDGKVMRQHRQETTTAGLNTFVLPIKGMPVGAYLLLIMYQGEHRQFRVAVGP